MTTTEKIAREIKNYLEENRITMADAARRMGISQQAVSSQLSGSRKMGANVARKWSEAFGFSPAFLIAGEGSLSQYETELATPEGGELLVLPMSARPAPLRTTQTEPPPPTASA